MSKWPRVPLSQVAISVDYGVTSSATSKPVGPKFLRITDIQSNAVDWHQVPWCECSVREAKEANLRSGDIVFARTGATTGKTFLIKDCPKEAIFASYLIRVRLGAKIDPHFVNQFFQSSDYWAQISKGARGVAQPGVNATTLKALSLPLPSLPEQRRIAAILDQADALRTQRREALAQLDSLTHSIFIEMFGDPATNPKGWPEVEIADLCEVKGGKRLPKGADYATTPTPFRYIRVTDIRSGTVDETRLVYLKPEVQSTISRYIVNTGDVIISIAGSIGLIAPVPPSLAGANLTENAAKLVPRADTPCYEPVFLAKALQTPFAQHQISSHVGQVTIGKLALFRIEKVRLPLPPIDAQRRFASSVEAVSRLRRSHQASIEALDALFASLQHRAFAGQL
jgi:type I restriction enzyme S subunit